ncbi:MarR family winged helix-turn-helix transcriptional regulator [Mollicutes bacterium LVI A0078]|nr:MarR family winged helix-turn-helix transcriptional regulator [Mollicutes bacterium LVI A0075]WOO90410.1 MarR family winged helix-turn-helix transcriptional regulator [Mollicutes bacterium LVI A0078]
MTIEKIIQVANKLEAQLNERYSDYGLTVNQADLLIYFYQFGQNEISAQGAIDDLGIDKRLMSLAIKSLEKKDYIVRHTNAVDKRQKDIELSIEALEMCEDLILIKEEVNAIFEASLDFKQVQLLNSLEME